MGERASEQTRRQEQPQERGVDLLYMQAQAKEHFVDHEVEYEQFKQYMESLLALLEAFGVDRLEHVTPEVIEEKEKTVEDFLYGVALYKKIVKMWLTREIPLEDQGIEIEAEGLSKGHQTEIMDLDGEPYFVKQVEGGVALVGPDGERIGGHAFVRILSVVKVEGKLFFTARVNENLCALVGADGKYIDLMRTRTDQLISTDREPAYIRLNEEGAEGDIRLLDGSFYADAVEYESLKEVVPSEKELYVVATRGGKDFILGPDGTRVTNEYKEIKYPIVVNGVLYFLAKKGTQWIAVGPGEKEILREENIKRIDVGDGEVFFLAHKEMRSAMFTSNIYYYVNSKGQRVGEEYEGVSHQRIGFPITTVDTSQSFYCWGSKKDGTHGLLCADGEYDANKDLPYRDYIEHEGGRYYAMSDGKTTKVYGPGKTLIDTYENLGFHRFSIKEGVLYYRLIGFGGIPEKSRCFDQKGNAIVPPEGYQSAKIFVGGGEFFQVVSQEESNGTTGFKQHGQKMRRAKTKALLTSDGQMLAEFSLFLKMYTFAGKMLFTAVEENGYRYVYNEKGDRFSRSYQQITSLKQEGDKYFYVIGYRDGKVVKDIYPIEP